MALVRFTEENFATAPENDAPRADWQEGAKVGPIGHWYAGQKADLHEDEVQAVVDAGVAELIERDGGEMSPFNRPLWTEAVPGAEWGSEEQATIEDRPAGKKVASAQGEPVTATRKFSVPGSDDSATLDPAAELPKALGGPAADTGKTSKTTAKKRTAKKSTAKK
jgi:hypothetical protein